MSEADTCRTHILPNLYAAGWRDDQIRERVTITDGRVTPVGRKRHSRGPRLRPDYILDLRPFYPIAVVEAKDDYKEPDDGLQQAMAYALRLGVSFAYGSNGRGIVEHDFLTGVESRLDRFPTPEQLWARLRGELRLADDRDAADALAAYYEEVGGKTPRYYQQIAINRAVEAVITGRRRILITMATGTGKTFVAFQLIWRLWKAKRKKRILYLADRNFLVDQAKDQTFAPMGDAMVKLSGRRVVKSREMYFALYQALYNPDGGSLYEKYPRDFFDLIIVDECHRGSARDDSSWRQILDYFSDATQIGLTATPRRIDNADTYAYFGDPVYTYSLAEGIDDGFLAPYRVQRIIPSSDALGVLIEDGDRDRFGREIPPGLYGTADFERVLSVLSRTRAVAHHLTEYLQEHAAQMRYELARLNADLMRVYPDYVARVVSDEGHYGRGHLDHFQDPEKETPVIVTSSQMLTTGVDAPTVHNIVLFRAIGSIVEFKQIIRSSAAAHASAPTTTNSSSPSSITPGPPNCSLTPTSTASRRRPTSPPWTPPATSYPTTRSMTRRPRRSRRPSPNPAQSTRATRRGRRGLHRRRAGLRVGQRGQHPAHGQLHRLRPRAGAPAGPHGRSPAPHLVAGRAAGRDRRRAAQARHHAGRFG